MTAQSRKLLITGGAGFIGTNLIQALLSRDDCSVLNIDKLCFPGSIHTARRFEDHSTYHFVQADICDQALMHEWLEEFRPDSIIHLAAESHVDRSIDSPEHFIDSNIRGTFSLLQAGLNYWRKLDKSSRDRFRFHHVSTDEVYGSLGPTDPAFVETSPCNPSSPYSASKAAADCLVKAWHKTYGLPAVISNCSNNYGPYQFPEKLIPLIITKAIQGEPLPVYGKGENIRDWLYVTDHADALVILLDEGRIGETYNIGGGHEISNINLVIKICQILDSLHPADDKYENQIRFVKDRPGHDYRYAINSEKISQETGWAPAHDPDTGLRATVQWYVENLDWCRLVMANSYHGERLGIDE